MDAVGPIEVQLVGGELDGDTFAMQARGSTQPPDQLLYLSKHKSEACWLVYGPGRLGLTPGWPTDSGVADEEMPLTRHDYLFLGKFSLDFQRQLA